MTDIVQTPAATPETKGRSLFQLAAMRFKRNRAAMAGCVMLALIAIFSFLGPLFVPHTYDQVFPSYVNIGQASRARIRPRCKGSWKGSRHVPASP